MDSTHKGTMLLIQHYIYDMMYAKAGVSNVDFGYSS